MVSIRSHSLRQKIWRELDLQFVLRAQVSSIAIMHCHVILIVFFMAGDSSKQEQQLTIHAGGAPISFNVSYHTLDLNTLYSTHTQAC